MASNRTRERMVIGIALVIPALMYVVLRLEPTLDPTWSLPVFHFYIVSFTSLVALVSASFVFLEVGDGGVQPIFLTIAFAVMAGIFFTHGFATPNVMMHGPNQAVGWSARLSLTAGAMLIALAMVNYSPEWQRRIIQYRDRIWLVAAIIFLIYVGLIFEVPEPFAELSMYDHANQVIAAVTILLLTWATFRVWKLNAREPGGMYRALIIALPWLGMAQISQYEAPLWAFSWWMYHLWMLGAYFVTIAALVSNYERGRDFRLTRYFISVSVILGLPLAFFIGEAAARLTERNDLRWTLFGFIGIALLLLVVSLFSVVRRAQYVMNARALAIEREKQWRADLTSLIAHDLKNPLNSIFLDLYMIEHGKLGAITEQQRDRLERTQRNARAMVELIDNMLDVERSEAGALQLDKEATDLRTIIEKVVNDMYSQAELQKIALITNFCDNLPMLPVDRGLMERVVQNLVGNALKFTPADGKITIATSTSDSFVEIKISDTGSGVPEDQREVIFEKFGQVRQSDHKQGFGLGLAFCRMAVEKHGGKIHVEDAPGGGSMFVFTLPLQEDGVPESVL
ncbi:MAG TPA: HAMP domain-containing sensor histidine kinase [Aggregatilineales bacterium]|nr:HAMP domain-containing sensor histidine kinase [Aggregatilineales bacterium]